ncbi:TM0996/MTH895 family glutaredoxin-like protein [Myxococcota bacterium]|jgi:small redox-active disulfide protein 2|nr:TM0996/MTH895 family glutaredoxin-like protein [Myxococcota bacterium]
MEIKVLGTGCPKCRKLYEEVRKAVESAGVSANVEKVEDITRILEYDVMITPALVINGEVKASGRVPGVAEMVAWIINAAAAEG